MSPSPHVTVAGAMSRLDILSYLDGMGVTTAKVIDCGSPQYSWLRRLLPNLSRQIRGFEARRRQLLGKESLGCLLVIP